MYMFISGQVAGGHLQLPVQPPEFLLNPTFKTWPRSAVNRVVLVKLSRSPQVAYEYHGLLYGKDVDTDLKSFLHVDVSTLSPREKWGGKGKL